MPAPTVTAASPNIGSTQGGTNITLTGTDFTGTTGVTIGGVAATNVVVVSATSITLTTPAGSAGVGSVLVTNSSGTNGANSLFFYIAATPTDTYVYLRGGRGDGFVPTWTGALTEEGEVDANGAIVGTAGKEVSEPYRDIHNNSTNIALVDGSDLGAGILPIKGTALIPTTITPASLPGGASGDMLVSQSGLGTVSIKVSDDVNNTPPRQFYKVYTWWVFTSSNGIAYKFRKADVIGIGSQPRT